LKLQE
jgi:hypothetical protein